MSTPAPQANNGDTPQALKSWWSGFKKGKRKAVPPAPVEPPRSIFGVPLKDSIQYANVAISLMDDDGKSFIYGYVPIVVAKCGVYLKEKATDIEGIFRLSGSAKRIKELQEQFDSPPRYGKGLDWTGYTVHDAANVLRRYLNQLPQPIVPLEFYERFRLPLRGHQSQAVGNSEAQVIESTTEFDQDKAIVTYQDLITKLPPLNRQLLLYVLDLLSVFAFKSDVNLMTSANLAAIFQPGMLTHPDHHMAPLEYRLSQDVIIFLIEHQDNFLIGMSGTAVDEKTVREVQAGPQPSTPSKASGGLGRSVSNASGGGESARKLGIRRNISVSSKNSKHSSTAQTPATPQSGTFSPTVQRSNTVPSKRSPGLGSTRPRGLESPTTAAGLSPSLPPSGDKGSTTYPTPTVNEPAPEPTLQMPTDMAPGPADRDGAAPSQDENILGVSSVSTPKKEWRNSGLLKQTPSSDSRDGLKPKKLQKQRPNARSANSSTNSLTGADYVDNLPMPKEAPKVGESLEESMGPSTLQSTADNTPKAKSPVGSFHSKSDDPDRSEQEQTEEAKAEKKRWRFSSAPKKEKEKPPLSDSTQPQGLNKAAGKSSGSIEASAKAQVAAANETTAAPLAPVASEQTQPSTQTDSIESKDRDTADEGEQKKGLFGRIRARMDKSRDEHRAKEAEKERAKSPPRNSEGHGSKHSLSQIAHDIMPHRERKSESEAPKLSTEDIASEKPAAEIPHQAPEAKSALAAPAEAIQEPTMQSSETTGEPKAAAEVKPTTEGTASTEPKALM